MFTLSRIRIYPIKSLDGHEVTTARLLPAGPLEMDRRYAIVDAAGKVVNGKREPRLHELSATYEEDAQFVELRPRRESRGNIFHLPRQREEAARWLSEFLGQHVALIDDAEQGFPDDPEASGPTLCAAASLLAVAGWFDELSTDEVRLRMRANLEVTGCPPFWEDELVTAEPAGVPFRIGAARLEGQKACARCAVPTRDSRTGEVMPDFMRHFKQSRAASLPPHVDRRVFDHFYRFALNTRVLETSTISLGDPVQRIA